MSTVTLVLTVALSIWFTAPQDLPFQIRNKDFANYWMGGKLAISGQVSLLFGDPTHYFEAMQQIFGADYPWHNWSYPPHALLFIWPLGFLNYLPAMALFLGLTLSLYLLSIRTMNVAWTPLALMLLAPFIVANLVSTQNGFATAALVIAGLMLREKSPIIAGILIGILTIKPQLGILLPVLLLLERRWSVIASAAVTGAILAALSVWAFGIHQWRDYVAIIAPYQTDVMNTLGGDFPHMMGSAFGSARSLDFSSDVAMTAHVPVAIVGLLLFGWLLWRNNDGATRALATVLATFLVVPYSVAYDYGALAAFAAAGLAREQDQPRLLRLLLILLAVLPVAMLPLGQAGAPVTPLLLLATLAMLAISPPLTSPER